MGADAYNAKVRETAQSFLTENAAREWKEENEADDFWDFFNNSGEYGCSDAMHRLIDSTCAQDWTDAIEVLQNTSFDPDHVDPGLYDGSGWQKILVIIAFECFREDVTDAAQRLYDAYEFEDTIVDIPTTKTQIGYNDERPVFEFDKHPLVINLQNGVKLLHAMQTDHEFSVVFEGPVEERPSSLQVTTRRVYIMSGAVDIEEALTRCREEFGVRKVGE